MPMFEGDVLRQTIAVASKYKIEPAALLAVIEVESAGRSHECDNTTPRLLFERHVFYRELQKAGVKQSLGNAVAAGLAHDGWRPGSQYKDQSTSAKRLALLIRVRAINEECANRSCSWGVGQTMGFLAQELKFTNANHMLQYLVQGGVPAQIDCMVREIVRKKIVGYLNAHNWARFARVYNGPGYKKNAYDTKMAAAYAKWRLVKLPAVDEPTPVIVPMEVTPDPFAKEVSGETGKIVAATAAGAVSTAAGLWGFVDSMGLETIYSLSVFWC